MCRLQLDVKDSEYGEVQRKSQLLAALRELYSSGQISPTSVEREDSDPPNIQEDNIQLHQPTQVQVHKYNIIIHDLVWSCDFVYVTGSIMSYRAKEIETVVHYQELLLSRNCVSGFYLYMRNKSSCVLM